MNLRTFQQESTASKKAYLMERGLELEPGSEQEPALGLGLGLETASEPERVQMRFQILPLISPS